MLRFLGGLFLAALLVFVVGYFAGWIRLDGTSYAGGEDVTFRLDQREMGDDLEEVGDGARHIADRVGDAIEEAGDEVGEAVDGAEDVLDTHDADAVVLRVDAPARELTVTLEDGEELTLSVPDVATEGLASLTPGDSVRVVYTRPRTGPPVVRTITRDR